jgi:hypothetical protein
MLLLALSPAPGFGQTANKVESQVAQEIAQCMVEGPPPDWTRLYMIIELPEPNAASGRTRYMADRDFSPDPVAYKPCDSAKPARLLMDARESLPAERRGWTGARFVIHRDTGRFDISYDYPR